MRVAMASCTKVQNQPDQPVWTSIRDATPDHLLLLGDNVYAPVLTGRLRKLEKRYEQQFKVSNFRDLIQTVPFNATWDDHDFGWNNIKGAYVDDDHKTKARELFHRFMNCSTNLPHVYHSVVKNDVKIIMLDVRYYRQKWHHGPNATVLGQDQEKWLEHELNTDPTKFTLVCSGSCLTEGDEKLMNYEKFYPWLCGLLKKRGRTLFLSGDIHENKFIEHDGFFEITSSGAGRNGLNNFGILDLGKTDVHVRLSGSRARDNLKATIDTSKWKRK